MLAESDDLALGDVAIIRRDDLLGDEGELTCPAVRVGTRAGLLFQVRRRRLRPVPYHRARAALCALRETKLWGRAREGYVELDGYQGGFLPIAERLRPQGVASRLERCTAPGSESGGRL